MANPEFIEIDGKRYLWRAVLQMRREQKQAAANAVHQRADAVGRRRIEGFRLSHLDDISVGARIGRACPQGRTWLACRLCRQDHAHRDGRRRRGIAQADRVYEGCTVFNCEQIEGLQPPFYATATPPKSDMERIASAEAFTASTGAVIWHGGNRAYYSITHDHVQMPPFESFRDAESYYATLLHELTRWTRHETRLNREFGRSVGATRAMPPRSWLPEGLRLGLSAEPRDDHSSYLASWLQVLKNDNRAIFSAAAHAQRAADYLHGLQRQELDQAAE
jgi:antirestriction protein ArdC